LEVVIASGSVPDTLMLIEVANDRGGKDSVTVIQIESWRRNRACNGCELRPSSFRVERYGIPHRKVDGLGLRACASSSVGFRS
jgi:hypothetical protein